MTMWPLKTNVNELPKCERTCATCHHEKNLKKQIDMHPCNKCDSSISPPPYWKDYRLFET